MRNRLIYREGQHRQLMAQSSASVGTIAKQSLIYAISTWAGRFFSVISTPILTRILTPEDYGIVDFIATLEAAIMIIISLGVDAGFRRYYVDSTDEAERHAYIGTGYLVWGGLNSLMVLAILLNAGWVAENLVGDASLTFIVEVAAIAMFCTMVQRMTVELLRDNMLVRVVAMASVLLLFIRLSLSVIFVAVFDTGVIGLYYAAIIAVVVVVAYELIFVRQFLGFAFSFPKLKQMLQFGLPLIPARVATYLIFYSDRYFINYFLTLSDLGIYAVGNKVANLLNLVTGGFVTAWGPYVLSTFREDGSKETFARVFRLYASLLYVLTMGLSVFSVEILLTFTTREFVSAYEFTPLLVYALVLYGIGFYFSVGIDITSKTYHRTWISSVAIVLNPLLNLLLIPPYAIMGAAIATLISYIVYCYLSLMVSERIYPVGYAVGRFTVMLMIGSLGVIAVYALQEIDLLLVQILWKSAAMLMIATLPLLFNLVTLDEVRDGLTVVMRRVQNTRRRVLNRTQSADKESVDVR